MILKHIAKPETKESLSLNLVSAFCTMIATVQDGNTRWTLSEILDSWIPNEVERCKELYHSMVRLKAYLYVKGCSTHKVKLPRDFVLIHKNIMSYSFESIPLSEVYAIDSKISKYIGYNIKLKPVGEYIEKKEEKEGSKISPVRRFTRTKEKAYSKIKKTRAKRIIK